MSEFIVAIGLVFVFEGLVFAAFPGAAKRASLAVQESPENTLRLIGLASAVVGLIIIWAIRH
jgi:uncharacterized protein YjeT (DUF2065 family)